MELDSDDTWSVTSAEEDCQNAAPLQSRAYQIEMFEASMKGNIIAVMSTGSGKTWVAKLRIEAELERTPNKIVWFTAPSVVLAYQQYRFLSQQLPAFKFKLITGQDNAEYWTTPEIWKMALHNVQVVISTPAILLNALNLGFDFLSLETISLLVHDEAHHCVGNTSLNSIMKFHYHHHNTPGTAYQLPHILGLSASPITKKKAEEIAELEKNLNATCKSPLRQLGDYTTFVNMPEIVTLIPPSSSHPRSQLLALLSGIVFAITPEHDPFLKILRNRNDPRSQEKLEKILKKRQTPAMEELNSLVRMCTDMQQNLGNWACDMFIQKCIVEAELSASRSLDFVTPQDALADKQNFVASRLRPLNEHMQIAELDLESPTNTSSKVQKLLDFLQTDYHPDVRCLIFVKTRSTAWALAEIINNHPDIRGQCHAFSFVGVSNPARKGIFEFTDLASQHDNLESFRRGELNVCVGTSVLEEGVDVPAMNLVICFDERPNFRSFIQSRGRARHKNSRFVMFPEATIKMNQWKTLEDEMKRESEKSLEAIKEREEIERRYEDGGEVFRVERTGALLTFGDARQRVDHFCAKLPQKESSERQTAIYHVEGEPGVEVRAKIYLPSSLPLGLQTAESKNFWLTERKAKQDAAFQAFRALHEAGLVTDNLLPLESPKDDTEDEQIDDAIEKRDSFYDVQRQWSPWPKMMELWETADTIYAHQLQIEASDYIYPRMLVLLPVVLPKLVFPLYADFSTPLTVTIAASHEKRDFPIDLGRDITLHLLMTILGRRLQGLQKKDLPFLLVPDIDQISLGAWYDTVSIETPMSTFTQTNHAKEKSLLVRRKKDNVPLLWPVADRQHSHYDQPDIDDCLNQSPQTTGAKLSRRMEYLTPANVPTKVKTEDLQRISIDECSVLGLPADYGRVMLFIPSITYMLEMALRSAEAMQGPLSTIGFLDVQLVSEALTTPMVSTRNYQRFEFYGDSLLKFYASLQVFADHPYAPEGQLTIHRSRVINNARLQRATRALGLDQYLTHQAFSGSGWYVGVNNPKLKATSQKPKGLSSKTLADMIEALIGAASLSGVDETDSKAKVLAALKVLVPEIGWQPVSESMAHISTFDSDTKVVASLESLMPLQYELIDYSFRDQGLLAQALTQSSLINSTYDRLEFLGDAVLDCIVSPRLFLSPLQLDPEEMTIRHHALVCHPTLAFFAVRSAYTRVTFEMVTDAQTRKTVSKEKTEKIHLCDHIRLMGNNTAPQERQTTLKAFEAVQDSIWKIFASRCGKTFPWADLSHLAAPKSFSDVIESILGAIFVDSGGDLSACESFLKNLGYMNLVRRLCEEDDFDARHPEAVLRETLQAQGIRCRFDPQDRSKKAKHAGTVGNAGPTWRCAVTVGEERIAGIKNANCRDEACIRAAEKALGKLKRKREREKEEEEQKLKDRDEASKQKREGMEVDVEFDDGDVEMEDEELKN